MTTNNASNSSSPLAIAQGGTGQITATAAFNVLSPLTTKGDILTYDSAPARLAVGTNDQVFSALASTSTGNQFSSSPTVGVWKKIEAKTAASSANIVFNNLSSTYSIYKIVMTNYVPADSARYMSLIFSSDNGSNFLTPGYFSLSRAVNATNNISNPTTGAANFSSNSFTSTSFGNAVGQLGFGEIYLYGMGTATFPYVTHHMMLFRSAAVTTIRGAAMYNTSITANAVRIAATSGNITSGKFTLYGFLG